MRAQETVLSNGLKVIYLQNLKNINYHIDLHVGVGAKDDPTGKSGLAHVLEHCVLMQTEQLRGSDVLKLIQKIGGQTAAFTSESKTNFPMSARAEEGNLFIICDLMRQIITEPYFEEERIEKEKKVILNEYFDDLDNDDRADFIKFLKSQQIRSVLEGRVLGNADEFMTITSADLEDFIRSNYKANTMVLYAVGPQSMKDAIETFEQTLSAIPSGGKPFALPKSEYGSRDVREENNKHQNKYSLFFSAPIARNLHDISVERVTLSRIQQSLVWHIREKSGCTYSPEFAKFDADNNQQLYSLTLTTRPEQTDDFLESLADYIEQVSSMSDEELCIDLVNTLFSMQHYSDQNNINCDCGLSVFDQLFSQTFDYEEQLDVLKSIQPDDIRNKMKEMLGSLNGLYIRGPEPDLFPSLEIVQHRINRTNSSAFTAQTISLG